MTKQTKNQDFIPMFKAYKKGITLYGPVTILAKKGEPFDLEAKITKYLSLGYSIERL